MRPLPSKDGLCESLRATRFGGRLTFDDLKRKTDVEVSDQLMKCKGFGDWSTQHVLMRGLGRPDCLPSEDTGLRRAVAMYLSHRRYLSPEQRAKRQGRVYPA